MTRWEGDKGAGSQKWIEQAIRRHGRITPARLEHRRQGLSVTIAMIEDTIKKFNLSRKMYIADAQSRQTEVLEKIKAAKAKLSEAKPDAIQAATTEVTQWENTQRMLVREYEGQMLYYHLSLANLKKYQADIEIGCLIIDHLGVQEKVKDGKTGLVGYRRLTAGACLDDATDAIFWIAKALQDMMGDVKKGGEEEDEEEELPVVDGEGEVFTDKDREKLEAKKRDAEND
jgi:hypothetical protein